MSEALLPLAAASAGAAAVVGRLAAREQQAVAEREARQAAQQQGADAREDVAAFVAAFTTELKSLAARAEALRVEAQAAVDTKQTHLVAQLHALSLDVTSLEKATSTASFFLPAYELRSCSGQLQQLHAQLAGVKQALQPKRKFAFATAVARTSLVSSAAAAAGDGGDSYDAASAPPTPAQQHQEAAVPGAGTAEVEASPRMLSAQDAQLIAAGHGFAGLRGCVLVATGQQLTGQAFVLHDLQDCQVFLLGSMRALRLQGLVGCAVFSGPVVGATFVDGASGCTLMLASHQVRIHSVSDSDVYLRVRSRPIIEHSAGLRFAPYAAEQLLGGGSAPPPEPVAAGQESQLAEQLEAAQLTEDSGLWASVDDFGWVKASASPHWCVLPEGERQAPPARLPA